MVGTIIPVVHRHKMKKRLAPRILTVHAFGYLLSSALVGAGLAGIGVAARIRYALGSRAMWVVVIAGLLLVSRDVGLLSFPLPQRRWQVPARWRSWPLLWMAFAYGLGLGVGFATRIRGSGYYFVALWCLIIPQMTYGLIVMSGFGLGRLLPLLWLSRPRYALTFAETAAHSTNLLRVVGYLSSFCTATAIVWSIVMYRLG